MSSIIAVTFTSIRPSLEPAMVDGDKGGQKPPEDDSNRAIENAVMLAFFAVLVAAGIWLLSSMADVRKAQDCAAQGRRNCGTIDVPAR